jgi:hypothetical protein
MADLEAEKPGAFIYRGLSMWPCFQSGDLLFTIRMRAARARRGDCVVYENQASGSYIVHRVAEVRPKLRTRGDAHPAIDDHSIPWDASVGLVIELNRGGQSRKVRFGFRGRLAGVFYRLAGKLDPRRTSRGGRAARLCLSLSSPARHLYSGKIRISKYRDRDVIRLWKRTIGYRSDQTGTWEISWPDCLWIAPRRIASRMKDPAI